jgi:hypothetical protein
VESNRAELARGSAQTGSTELEPSLGLACCYKVPGKMARGSARWARGSARTAREPSPKNPQCLPTSIHLNLTHRRRLLSAVANHRHAAGQLLRRPLLHEVLLHGPKLGPSHAATARASPTAATPLSTGDRNFERPLLRSTLLPWESSPLINPYLDGHAVVATCLSMKASSMVPSQETSEALRGQLFINKGLLWLIFVDLVL